MRRVHALEWADLPAFPGVLGRYMSQFLAFVGALSDAPYRRFAERLAAALKATRQTRVLELSAGHAGPPRRLIPLLEERDVSVEWTHTDLVPPEAAMREIIVSQTGAAAYVAESVDATQVPPTCGGFRVIVNAFHHLRPAQARATLADVVARGEGIAVLEVNGRSAAHLAGMLPVPLISLVTSPFVKPFSLLRILLCIVPVLPALILWDGVASCLRVYDPHELRELTDGLTDNYIWDAGTDRIEGMPGFTTYLIGHPNADQAAGPGQT